MYIWNALNEMLNKETKKAQSNALEILGKWKQVKWSGLELYT